MIAGQIMQNIFDVIPGAHADSELRERAWRILRQECYKLASRTSWEMLRERVTVDFSSADATGMYIPDNVLGIDLVWDADAEIEFLNRTRAGARKEDFVYRYYLYRPSENALSRVEDAVISHGGSSFTSDAIDALIVAGSSVDDEWIRFGNELDMYQIDGDTSPYGLDRVYYGPTLAGDVAVVRSKEARKMMIIDPGEDNLLDRDVQIDYWRIPHMPYNEDDELFMPLGEALELSVLQRMPEAKATRPVNPRETKEAVALELRMNPTFERPARPVGRNNTLFRFNKTNNFTDR